MTYPSRRDPARRPVLRGRFVPEEARVILPLSAAERRVLQYLPTHLSFREIGKELYLSHNTIKTQAISTYRKLGVGSRSEAVAVAQACGLLPKGKEDDHRERTAAP